MNKLIMTPGPTEIEENVLMAMATKGTNPDLDPLFYERYKGIVHKYNQLIGTKSAYSIFMSGEALLGLEAACASLVEPGDKVLCIANGYFGIGFKDFVAMYGGTPILLEVDWTAGVDVEAVKAIVKKNSDIKVATMVHCETPTGITNNIAAICQYLKACGIISVVDSVSGIGGEYVDFDKDGIDVLLGGTQKCLSAPVGLTLITISDRARQKITKRKTAITGYYTNIQHWLNWYEEKKFPYTQPLQNLYGLEVAIGNACACDFVKVHQDYAHKVRTSFLENGFKLFGRNSFSNTVTAIKVPDNIDYSLLFKRLNEEHHILIGGCLGDLKGKVFRVGHMGANNKEDHFKRLFSAMDTVFKTLGRQSHLLETYIK